MASAKKEAQNYLGSVNDYINLKGLNEERQIANNIYNTDTASFQNAYNDLLNTINNNRTKAKSDFSSGRATVSENAYLRNRSNLSDLASRGLSGGLAQLGKLGNRIETGRQYSDLANTYYNSMNDLEAQEKTGTNQYNTQMEGARNTLNAALAQIGSREAAGRNAYKAAVAQLAEQIQARRDAAAAAARSLALQRQQYNDAKKAQLQEFNARLSEIAGYGDNLTEDSYKKAINYYKNTMGGTEADAINYLTSKGIGYGVVGASGPQQPWVAPKTGTSTTTKKSTTKTSAAKIVKKSYSRAHSGRATKKK